MSNDMSVENCSIENKSFRLVAGKENTIVFLKQDAHNISSVTYKLCV